ncbi:alpha-L-fucosidase [Pelagicoccus mobilis]|uniref:alpha-L-fucosidase n=1 Tax=Pelagicoccus mobilis TaxID=415221 RepID=A0A934RY78_9BACT|nr:alpha-L-fucosidase [Pelagicoccus mobilis]MBK1876054.1 alpha-L-fucosidase [Pelagicoccus mobilis]
MSQISRAPNVDCAFPQIAFRLITVVAVVCLLAGELLANGAFKADWSSLRKAEPPQWWDEGKFGIFIHWGPYSVAGYKHRNRGYAEAITSDLYKKPENYVEFMTDKFGAAPPEFGYKDMVPLFRAEKWDPEEWAALFKESGAKYVIPTGEHHDGYVLWDSDLTPWAATKKGPMRDLIGDLAEAVRAEGLRFGISYHRERHPNRFTPEPVVHAKPHDQIAEEISRMPEAASLYGPFEYDDAFIEDYVARWKEAERKYQPDFMWIDDVPILRDTSGSPQVKKFEDAFKGMIADYLNAAKTWGKDVYFNNKGKTENWPLGVGCREADNLQMETIGPRWQNPATLGTSYAYMAAEEEQELYKTSTELVRLLCDVVSKNGNLLLNIGPRADGTIPEGMQRRLRDMGRWLDVNGEAIYASRPWGVYGESQGELIEEEGVHYSKHSMRVREKEFRYTAKEDAVYAIAFHEEEKRYVLKSFSGYEEKIKSVSLLGSDKQVNWALTQKGLRISVPGGFDFEHAAVFKISR